MSLAKFMDCTPVLMPGCGCIGVAQRLACSLMPGDMSCEAVPIDPDTSVLTAAPIGILFLKFCKTVFGVTSTLSPLIHKGDLAAANGTFLICCGYLVLGVLDIERGIPRPGAVVQGSSCMTA